MRFVMGNVTGYSATTSLSLPVAPHQRSMFKLSTTLMILLLRGQTDGTLKQNTAISDIWKYLAGKFFHIIFSPSVD
jgi:hypothetical protein